MSNEEAELEEAVEEELAKDLAEKSNAESVVAEENLEATEEEDELEEEAKSEEEEDIVEERVYTVPLGKVWISPRKKHSPKAVRVLTQFIMRHMKAEKDSIKITNAVNEKIWKKGIEKPPRKIRVRVTKDSEGIVTVRPAEGK